MPDCIFCSIVAGRAPSLTIYEDALTVAFVPRSPEVVGHTLVVPRAHHVDAYALPPDLLSAVFATCQTLAQHWRGQVGASGINLLHASGVDAEQTVPHFHVHVFPRFPDDGVRMWPALTPPVETRESMHARFRLAP